MQHMVATLLWAWIVLVARVHSVTLPQITDMEFADECVREHNKARSDVSPPATDMEYMIWDKDLAIIAKQWAAQCLFIHNDNRHRDKRFPSVGENLWAGYPPSYFNVTRAIQKWVDEKKDYNYYSSKCTKVCGHYTQVVWAQSYRVGCAVQLCPNGVKETNFHNEVGVIFVCNYGPGGNINGRQPYKTGGSSCSGCTDTCVGKLCRSHGQEVVKNDNVMEAVANGDLNYVPILVIRPLGFFFTFVAAYVARRFYPDVFCYE